MAGRKAHAPTDEARAMARRMSGEGRTRREIAQAIGVSVPTLAKCYAGDLRWPDHASAPLLDHVAPPSRPPPPRGAGRSGGRPEFSPTHDHRRDVTLFLADGWSKADIAAALSVSVPTLEKHFADELRSGAIAARADNLRRLRAAAAKGNVSAMRTLQERFDTVEAAHKTPAVEPAKPKEDTPGKKVQAQRAAHEAVAAGPWAERLGFLAN
jgi:hypothetical protein